MVGVGVGVGVPPTTTLLPASTCSSPAFSVVTPTDSLLLFTTLTVSSAALLLIFVPSAPGFMITSESLCASINNGIEVVSLLPSAVSSIVIGTSSPLPDRLMSEGCRIVI